MKKAVILLALIVAALTFVAVGLTRVAHGAPVRGYLPNDSGQPQYTGSCTVNNPGQVIPLYGPVAIYKICSSSSWHWVYVKYDGSYYPGED